ncbi:MAG: GNAT family N-acetyltransferase [Paraglaciecola sp.]|uniref:GNAT family N-acetyltransferase n=1 Tax=Paraglaciecola sp. TaxID=1920173 RepID=UPI0032969F62
MEIRAYHLGEEHQIWQLFYQTVHGINAQDYSQNQLDAWAPNSFDQHLWQKKLTTLGTFVCVNSRRIQGDNDDKKANNVILGYSDLQKDGYIDHFFCHQQHQGLGVGTALMTYIHNLAQKRGITQLSADVSITAKGFFEKHDFNIVKSQNVLIRGQILENFKMVKPLSF